jgi:hypothetical protein
MVAPCRTWWGRSCQKGMVKRVKGAIWEGFPVSFPFRTSRCRGRKWWGYRSTIGYSKRREVCGDGSYVSEEWEEVSGGVSIETRGAWEWGGCWTSMVGSYRAWKIGGLWTWLNWGTCTDICWSACNLSWRRLAALWQCTLQQDQSLLWKITWKKRYADRLSRTYI